MGSRWCCATASAPASRSCSPWSITSDPAARSFASTSPAPVNRRLPLLPYGFPYLAWVLGRTLNRLGYSRVDVLGFSWAGALAQQFAFQNPRRCRRMILVATATGAVMVPASPLILTKLATPRRYRDPDYLASIAAEIYGGPIDLGTAAVAALGNSTCSRSLGEAICTNCSPEACGPACSRYPRYARPRC